MKSLTVMLSFCLMIGLSGVVFAGITDPEGDAAGAKDLIAASAEFYERSVGGISEGTLETLLKLSVETAEGDGMAGAVIFECDVDGSAGTGGSISQIGAPVTPCPCKTVAGMDIAITVYNRPQGADSGSSFCNGCSDGQGDCATGRRAGEWYAMASKAGQPFRALGILRGFSDPSNKGTTADRMQYTFPYDNIVAYAQSTLALEDKFDFAAAGDPVANAKWQVSLYHDDTNYDTDQDDVTSNGFTVFDISDWAPNGDGNKADADAATDLTYCEGNVDGDLDVDGEDAAVFKQNFGRNKYNDPCDTANAWW